MPVACWSPRGRCTHRYAHNNMDTKNSTTPLAIVSGGTGYLGTVIVAELAAAGWDVVSLSRNTSDASAGVYTCDITDERAVHTTLAEIVATRGPISACIHAASPLLERIPILSVSTSAFDSAMDTAVRGAFLLAKETAQHRLSNAAFIGITTQAIEPGVVQPFGAYIPAKYALRGLLRALSAEGEQGGLRVYAVAPGFLPGGLNDDLPKQMQDFFARKSGTNAESPQEIAALVRKLCAGDSEFPPGSSIAFPSLVATPL